MTFVRGPRENVMVEREHCGDEFWDVECDQPLGHGSAHSAFRYGGRVSWLDEHKESDPPSHSGGQRLSSVRSKS